MGAVVTSGAPLESWSETRLFEKIFLGVSSDPAGMIVLESTASSFEIFSSFVFLLTYRRSQHYMEKKSLSRFGRLTRMYCKQACVSG